MRLGKYLNENAVFFQSGELPYASYPWDLPRTVLRSYSSLDLENVPELPDDLIKGTTVYPGKLTSCRTTNTRLCTDRY